MKWFMLSLVLMLSTVQSAWAHTEAMAPDALIETVSTQLFKRLSGEQEQIAAQPNHLKNVVREELLPFMNVRYAAYRVLGRNLKKTTKVQRDQFVDAFDAYLVTTFAQVLTQYEGQPVQVVPIKVGDAKIVAVPVKVLNGSGPSIDLAFKLRKSNKTGKWKAYDIVAEGISLLDSKQSEISKNIRNKGIDWVVDSLISQSKKNISLGE